MRYTFIEVILNVLSALFAKTVPHTVGAGWDRVTCASKLLQVLPDARCAMFAFRNKIITTNQIIETAVEDMQNLPQDVVCH